MLKALGVALAGVRLRQACEGPAPGVRQPRQTRPSAGRRAWLVSLVLLAAALLAGCAQRRAPRQRAASDPNVVVIYAACGLGPALEAVRAKFETENPGKSVQIEADEPLTLMRKLEEGEKADIFIALGDSEIGVLEREGILNPSTRRDLGEYRVVLATPAGKPALSDCRELTSPNVKRMVMPTAGFASLGSYAKRDLERLKLWLPIQPKLQLQDTPLKALRALAEGKADAGVIFDPCPVLRIPGKVAAGSVRAGAQLSQEGAKPVTIKLGLHRQSSRTQLAQHFVSLLRSERAKADLAAAGVPMGTEGSESGE
jgi:molybdate transport system substrate-binding protein